MKTNREIMAWGPVVPVLIPAGDRRLMLNGGPIDVPCRVLSEENYQKATSALLFLRQVEAAAERAKAGES